LLLDLTDDGSAAATLSDQDGRVDVVRAVPENAEVTALLLRPDCYVAWSSASANLDDEDRSALRGAAQRGSVRPVAACWTPAVERRSAGEPAAEKAVAAAAAATSPESPLTRMSAKCCRHSTFPLPWSPTGVRKQAADPGTHLLEPAGVDQLTISTNTPIAKPMDQQGGRSPRSSCRRCADRCGPAGSLSVPLAAAVRSTWTVPRPGWRGAVPAGSANRA